MVVDLPTPGVPVMPTRTAPPVSGNSSCTRWREARWWSARRLSTSVMARAMTARSPARTPRASLAMSGPADSARVTIPPSLLGAAAARDHHRERAGLLGFVGARARQHEQLFRGGDPAGGILGLGAEFLLGWRIGIVLHDGHQLIDAARELAGEAVFDPLRRLLGGALHDPI